jgi:transcriptional regulator with GAF, ATPase, and Fis domain
MKFDEKEFFEGATLKICGSLDFEGAFRECVEYIKNFLPIDIASIGIMHLNSSIIEFVATIGPDSEINIPRNMPLPPDLHKLAIGVYLKPNSVPHVRIMDPLCDDIIYDYIFGANPDLKKAAAIGLRLKLEGEILGHLGFISMTEKYKAEHARFVQLLNEPFAIALVNYLRHKEVLDLKALLAEENEYLKDELRRANGREIIGADFGLKGVMEMVRMVAPMDSPVLILGETGTGKEIIANAIHSMSPRREAPFIKVNCGAIPDSLIDSELFGHEKGAFTGALYQKRGRFERAHGGTIFLDEIGELPPGAQVRLLRVLQEKEIERVGGKYSLEVDIRVIAATNKNLERLLMEGQFREDLYFRLKVFPIVLPPLRDRRIDIPTLVYYFIQKKSREMGITSSPTLALGAMERLQSYQWPGNVRELENAVEKALIINRSGVLMFSDIPGQREFHDPDKVLDSNDEFNINHLVANHIQRVLNFTGGQVHGPAGAAHLLNMSPSTLRRKMKKLGIPFGRKAKKVVYQSKDV